MRTTAESKLSEILLQAVNRIAFLEKKTKQIVYDELGYAIGRQGGSAVQYWVYHKKIPARLDDIENLARAIAHLNGWENENDLITFLDQARYPSPEYLAREILPMSFSPPAAGNVTGFSARPAAAFIVGSPVLEPRLFFGRSHELHHIFDAIHSQNMQSVAVCGPPHSGKTSLLHYLHKVTRISPRALRPGQYAGWLNQPHMYRWAYLDFLDPRIRTQPGLFNALLRQHSFPIIGSNETDQFVDEVCHYLVTPTVILLDEFHLAVENPDFTRAFWQALQSLAANLAEGKLSFIFASTTPPTDWLSLDLPAAPFLSIFGRQLTLGPLKEAEAREMVLSSPRPFSEEDTQWILQHSAGWPATLQVLCNARLLALEEGQTGSAWQAEALQNLSLYRSLLDG